MKTLRSISLLILLSSFSAVTSAKTTIDAVQINSETPNSVTLTVHYRYDGRAGKNIFASATMIHRGRPSTHFSFRPGRVARGKGSTRVSLSTNKNAPASFVADGIRIALYQGGKRKFTARDFRFAKTWTKPGTRLSTKYNIKRKNPKQSQKGDTVSRKITRDGVVHLEYSNGKRVEKTSGGTLTIQSNGTESRSSFSQSQPPTPPGEPSPGNQAAWVNYVNESLLGTIRQLVKFDKASVNAYLESENSRTTYERVNHRASTVFKLVSP